MQFNNRHPAAPRSLPTAAPRRGSTLLTMVLPLLFATACHQRVEPPATALEPDASFAVANPMAPPPIDAAGWSVFTPSGPNTRIVYVSSSTGNDSNSGLSPSLPKRTLAAGKALMRNGWPDWLLLKKGDVWDEALGNWSTMGRSIGEPQLVSSYGTGARPLIRSGASNGMSRNGGGSRPWLSVVGLHFRGRDNAPNSSPSGFHCLTPVEGLLIEDCCFERYQVGIVIQGFDGRIKNIRLRRNIVIDNYSVSASHPAGAYLSGVDGMLLEENVFDHNGWLPGVANATGPSIYRHNIYIQTDCTDCTLRDNYVMNAASHGAQMRSAGVATGNIFARNSISLYVHGNPAVSVPIEVECRDNVFLDGKDIDAANPRGWALDVRDVQRGIFSGNLFAATTQANFPYAMQFKGTIRDVFIAGNLVADWPRGLTFEGNTTTFSNILLQNNHIQDGSTNNYLLRHNDGALPSYIAASSFNTFDSRVLVPSQWILRGATTLDVTAWRNQFGDISSQSQYRALPDPTRSLGSYNAWLGGADGFDAFRKELRQQSKDTWRPEYSARAAAAWIREGFGM
jgi:hypothetical protein